MSKRQSGVLRSCHGFARPTGTTRGRPDAAGHRPPGRRRAPSSSRPLDGAGRAELVEQRLTDAIVARRAARRRAPAERVRARAQSRRRRRHRARGAARRCATRASCSTRRGRDGGSFVTYDRDAVDAAARRRACAALSRIELRDLALHYAAIAGMAAEIAADRASDDDLETLRRRSTTAPTSPPQAARAARVGRFQLEIAAISQSPRLVREELRLQAEAGPCSGCACASRSTVTAAPRPAPRVIDAIRDVRPVAARARHHRPDRRRRWTGWSTRRCGSRHPPDLDRARTAMNTTRRRTRAPHRAAAIAGGVAETIDRPVRDDRRLARRAARADLAADAAPTAATLDPVVAALARARARRRRRPHHRRGLRGRARATSSTPSGTWRGGCGAARAARRSPSPRRDRATPTTSSSATTRRSSGGGSRRAPARGTSPDRTSTTSAPTTTPSRSRRPCASTARWSGVVGTDVLRRPPRAGAAAGAAREPGRRAPSSTRRAASSPRPIRAASRARCCGSTGSPRRSRRCASRSRVGRSAPARRRRGARVRRHLARARGRALARSACSRVGRDADFRRRLQVSRGCLGRSRCLSGVSGGASAAAGPGIRHATSVRWKFWNERDAVGPRCP